MKVIYSGLESSGKSLQLAIVVPELVKRNAKWYAKQQREYDKDPEGFKERYKREIPQVRPIVSNLRFSAEFEYWAYDTMGVPIVYWTNLDELIKWTNADIIMDEVGNFFDSRLWESLSLDCRMWLSQGAKCGIELYGTAQDFAQVDKAFRRLVNRLYLIRKVCGSRRPAATMPPVRFIWGICLKSELDPNSYDEDKKKFKGALLPSWFYIRKANCEIFDTTARIPRSKPMPYKHTERICESPNCQFHRVLHV